MKNGHRRSPLDFAILRNDKVLTKGIVHVLRKFQPEISSSKTPEELEIFLTTVQALKTAAMMDNVWMFEEVMTSLKSLICQ